MGRAGRIRGDYSLVSSLGRGEPATAVERGATGRWSSGSSRFEARRFVPGRSPRSPVLSPKELGGLLGGCLMNGRLFERVGLS